MDNQATEEHVPAHHDNGQLGVFTNPLRPSQPQGYIGMVSTSNKLHYYFTHKCGCRCDSPNKNGNGANTNATTGMHNYSYSASDVKNVKSKMPLFLLPLQNVFRLQKSPKYAKLLVKFSCVYLQCILVTLCIYLAIMNYCSFIA